MDYIKNIREIAKITGVSPSTVSRILNNKGSFSKSTISKVMNAVNNHHYIPNQSARNVFSSRSNFIGIFVYDIRNPFYIDLIREANLICLENNYTLLICDVQDDTEREKQYFNYCLMNRCAGIIYTISSQKNTHISNDIDMPIVTIDRKPVSSTNCLSISSDNDQMLNSLVEYLYSLNHKKIGYISANEIYIPSQERFLSYKKSLKKFGLNERSDFVFTGEYDYDTGRDAFDYFSSLNDPPTAVISANDQIAHGFVNRAYENRVIIPDKFSVCGIDAVDYDKSFPLLTSAKQDTQRLASTAISFILDKGSRDISSLKIASSLRIGQSCKKL